MAKAQLTVEFLLILALLLLMLGIFVYLSQTSGTSVIETKIKSQAQGTVSDLSAAAKEVYAQGKGASKQVYITIPEGFEPDMGAIANRSIRIRVSGSDYVESEQFDVHGTLPATEGNHWVWVVSEGNSVRIGYSMVEISRSSLTLSMEPGESRSLGLGIRNIWPGSINVSLSRSIDPQISFMLDPAESGIGSGTQGNFALQISSSGAVGVFTGFLNIKATDGSIDEHVSIPITIIIHGGSAIAEEKKLFVVPEELNLTMQINSSLSRSILVCTDEETELDSVTLSPSAGEPGSWISGLQPIGGIGRDECIERIVNISVPIKADLGKYNGSLEFRSGSLNDSLQIKVDVGGVPYDATGPVVDSIYLAGHGFANNSLTLMGQVSDERSSIAECRIRVDSGPWSRMSAADGLLDELNETVYFIYDSGFPRGTHSASIQCTDSLGNMGETKEDNFTLRTEFLILRSGPDMSLSEQEWVRWMGLHSSNEGFSWNYEVRDAEGISEKKLDEYAVVIMAEFSNSSQISDRLAYHIGKGGYLVLLGAANQEGPFYLCSTNGIGSPYPTRSIFIYTKDHYITRYANEGRQNIFTIDSKIYGMPEDYIGRFLAASDSPWGFTVLGVHNSTVSWGVYRPFRMSTEGIELTRRVMDFALLESGK